MKIPLERGYFDEKGALRTLRQRISPYVFVSETGEESGRRYVTVGVNVQEAIPDHGGIDPVVRFLDFDSIATYDVRTMEGTTVLDGPSRTEVSRKLQDSYSVMVTKSQQALLPTVYQKLVHIPEVSLSMSPLRKILILLEEMGQVSPKTVRRRDQSMERVRKYFSLLEDLAYIARENGGYVAGKEFADLKAGDVEPPELYEAILGEVIRRRSKYLQEVLHWTMMVPFLRWSNSYYLPAYEAGHLLRLEREDLVGIYQRFYGYKRREAQIITQLQRTVDSGALRRERPFYLGDQSILDDYTRKADEEKVLPSEHSGQ